QRIANRILQLRQDLLLEQGTARRQRFVHHVHPAQDQHIEDEEHNRSRRRVPVVLEDLEGRTPLRVEGDDLTVNHGLVRDGGQRLDNQRVTEREVVVLARAKVDVPATLEG